MRTHVVRAALMVVLLAGIAAPAAAEGTLLFGLQTTSAPHPTVGVAWGRWPGTVGFELEYAGSIGKKSPSAPAVATITVNALVRTPLRVHGCQVYALGGFGVYGEVTSDGRGSGEVGARDIGGGTTIPIGGPLKLRLDYRVYFLGRADDASPGSPISRHPQRLAAAISLAF